MASITEKTVYASSSCFGKGCIRDILQAASCINVNTIELSAGIDQDADILDILLEHAKMHGTVFRVHNYFPQPQIPIVLNLASVDPAILAASKALCLEALNICSRLEIPYYSVHAGFCVHASPGDLGKPFAHLPSFSPKRALDVFIVSMQELADEAARFGKDILIENNVLARFNLLHGDNTLLLGVTAGELMAILVGIDRPNVHLLLDVGHLRVSATTLGLDPVGQVKILAGQVRAVHLSDNNGEYDAHEPIKSSSWFWGVLEESLLPGVDYVLETAPAKSATITEQLGLIETWLTRQGAA